MLKKKGRYYTAIGITVLCWLAFIWLRTFTSMTGAGSEFGVYGFLAAAMAAMTAGILGWGYFKDRGSGIFSSILSDFPDEEYYLDGEEDLDEDVKRFSGRAWNMWILTWCFVILYIAALLIEMWTDVFGITGDYIKIAFSSIDKKYIFFPLIFVGFPLWTQSLFEGIQEENCSLKSMKSGMGQLFLISALSFIFFRTLPCIWLLELAIVEIVVVVNAIRKYIWRSSPRKIVFVMLWLHIQNWCFFLAVIYRFRMQVREYTDSPAWGSYLEKLMCLMKGAAVFGTSPDLAGSREMLDFLDEQKNYLLTAFYYGGWGAAAAILVLLVLFLAASHHLLGLHAEQNKNYLIYHAVWCGMVLQAVLGVLSSFGFPIPTHLLFAGKKAFFMDTVALGLLIWSAIEAQRIDRSFYRQFHISDVFGNDKIEVEEQQTDSQDFMEEM